MSEFVIYHNPRCSKSRAALALLRDRGVEPQVIEYLKTPPDPAAIRALLEKLGTGPRALLRDGEPPYTKLRLSDPAKSDADLVAAIVRHPILLQRPIIVRGNRAVIGRPPDKVRELL